MSATQKEVHAMHEEDFLNSWLREDEESKAEEKVNKEDQEQCKSGKRKYEGKLEKVTVVRKRM